MRGSQQTWGSDRRSSPRCLAPIGCGTTLCLLSSPFWTRGLTLKWCVPGVGGPHWGRRAQLVLVLLETPASSSLLLQQGLRFLDQDPPVHSRPLRPPPFFLCPNEAAEVEAWPPTAPWTRTRLHQQTHTPWLLWRRPRARSAAQGKSWICSARVPGAACVSGTGARAPDCRGWRPPGWDGRWG